MSQSEPVITSPQSTASKKRLSKKNLYSSTSAVPRKQRVLTPEHGVSPPLRFDLTKVPLSHVLTISEVAAAVRRSPQTIRLWREQADHLIKFRKIDGRWMTTVADVLLYLASPQKISTRKR